jgi:hypothetical protein
MSPEPFPFVSVSGTPRERGRQYGAAVADRIRRSIGIYTGQIRKLGLESGDLQRLVHEFLPRIEAFGAEYVEEMRGIAEGAEVGLEEIVLVNARTEIVSLARLQAPSADEEPDGCTGAVILPSRSRNGRLIHGQNWDWRAECAETGIVLRVRREDGPDFLTFTEAGALARCGLNAAGIAITANYLECDRDYRQSGVPLPLIRRKVLEQEHFALAMRTVAVTPKACANNMMVSYAAGWAIDFECAPDESFPIYPEDGLIVHANHWLSPVALSKVKDTGIPSVPESFYRDWRVREHLAKCGSGLTRDDLKAALFDDFGSPYSVCRPPRTSEHGNLSATVAMIVMEPEAGFMEVAPLPAINRVFTRYSLEEEPVTLEAMP